MNRRALFLFLPLALGACSTLLPKPSPPPVLYRLNPLPRAAAAVVPVNAQLVVEPPTAPAALATARIALTRGAFDFDYFADAAWTEDAPALLARAVIDSLQNSGAVPFAAPVAAELRADAVLAIDLRRFEAAYAGSGPPAAEIAFNAYLLRPADRSVIAARSFSGSAAASANSMGAIVAAFDAALNAALRPMPDWVAASLRSSGR